jgi:hypothetical protein
MKPLDLTGLRHRSVALEIEGRAALDSFIRTAKIVGLIVLGVAVLAFFRT